jgi:hypothetical protein
VAPWNVLRYRLTVIGGVPHVDGIPVVFYHYHEYGRLTNGDHELGRYPITPTVVEVLYAPYIHELDRAKFMVLAIDPLFTHRRTYRVPPSVVDLIRSFSAQTAVAYLDVIKRKMRGRFHVYPDEHFVATIARLDRQGARPR